jgi:N-acetylglucosaminyldiphosphoundecaprenol N-acetyl-beta-D-mannosaminyltransferase
MGLNVELSSDSVNVLGVRFNTLMKRQVVEHILLWVAEKSRRMVITAGPEFVMQTHKDATLRRIAYVSDLVTPDGIGVVWAANRKTRIIQERVTGVELIQELLTTAEARHQSLRVYMLGASEDSLQGCLQRFRVTYPHAIVEGRDGYFSHADVPAIIQDIAAFKPDLWLVGLGQPRQEKLIYDWLGTLPPCVGVGIGGSIDIWSGKVKRAPRVFQRLNIEWLYRLLSQPQRLRRQMALPRFAWQVLKNRG